MKHYLRFRFSCSNIFIRSACCWHGTQQTSPNLMTEDSWSSLVRSRRWRLISAQVVGKLFGRIQTSQTGGETHSDTSPFKVSIFCTFHWHSSWSSLSDQVVGKLSCLWNAKTYLTIMLVDMSLHLLDESLWNEQRIISVTKYPIIKILYGQVSRTLE